MHPESPRTSESRFVMAMDEVSLFWKRGQAEVQAGGIQ